ncbi:MAG: type II toxin-antitoxin system VapC family toxin [Bifidobacteriaceae bacterium]|nr:type II toxin-antitoxin system VapC family toxin [Bifidobacteriaceae bacterium]
MTVVIDASLLAEMLVGSPLGRVAEARLVAEGDLNLPDIAGPQTASVARGWLRGGRVTAMRAGQMIEDLAILPARVWPTIPLLGRAWELRDNATIYDAVYVALAERLGAKLLTGDGRLGRGLVGRANCEIVCLAAGSETGG